MADITHLLRIRATPERVYQALTTPDGIRSWWTRDAGLEPQVGGTGTFRFYDRKRVTEVRIEALTRATHVGWKTIASFRPEWQDTTISFDLRAEEDKTVLSFAHRGFVHADEGYALATTGWAYYLVSLQQYLETGTGGPSPDIDFARMIRRPTGT